MAGGRHGSRADSRPSPLGDTDVKPQITQNVKSGAKRVSSVNRVIAPAAGTSERRVRTPAARTSGRRSESGRQGRAVQRDATVVQLLMHGQQQCSLAWGERTAGHLAVLADHHGFRLQPRLSQHRRKQAAGPTRLSRPGLRLHARRTTSGLVRRIRARDDVAVLSHHRSILPLTWPTITQHPLCSNSRLTPSTSPETVETDRRRAALSIATV